MVDFVFRSEKRGWLYGNRGVVKGVRKWSELSITSSGGGGHIGSYGGYIEPTKVSSSQTTKAEFWIRSSSGRETQIKELLAVDDGQSFTVLWGNISGQSTGPHLYWRNQTTGQDGLFKGALNPKFIYTTSDLTYRRNTLLLIWTVVFIGIWYETNSSRDFSIRHQQFPLQGILLFASVSFLCAFAIRKLFLSSWEKQKLFALQKAFREFSDRNDIVLDG